MRLWVRFRVVRAPGWDDFFVVLYLVSVIVLLTYEARHTDVYFAVDHDRWLYNNMLR